MWRARPTISDYSTYCRQLKDVPPSHDPERGPQVMAELHGAAGLLLALSQIVGSSDSAGPGWWLKARFKTCTLDVFTCLTVL